jgi:tetratricopeptide (TPR) repeat protein
MRCFTGFLTACIFLLLSSFSSRNAQSYYNEGIQSLRGKNFIKAIGDFTNAISIEPRFADAYYQRALAKELLAQQAGFISTEQCQDWIQALRFGKKEAAFKLTEGCLSECATVGNLADAPLQFLCADLSHAQLEELPATFSQLLNLVSLNLSGNHLNQLDKGAFTSEWLILLDASNNSITTVHEALGQLSYLEELNLSYNHVSELPTEVGQLHNLKVLYLRSNELRQVPASIIQLKSLQYLDLSFNDIKRLPREMQKLKNLKTLNLVGNPLSDGEKKAIQALLPNCRLILD